jgi:hypothetical protein
MPFTLGNSFKYIFRRNDKGKLVEDLQKAYFYVNNELEKRKSWNYSIMSRILFPIKYLFNSDDTTYYYRRTLLIERICNHEVHYYLGEVYRALNRATFYSYETKDLESALITLEYFINKNKSKNI